MIKVSANKRRVLLFPLVLMVAACGIASSYRPAVRKTIDDFSDTNVYRKTVGVLALVNTTMFTSPQVASPFLQSFLEGLKSEASDVRLRLADDTDAPSFLGTPPRIANGDIDVFHLSAAARQAGMNTILSPILMDIRVRKKDTGFWFFRDVSYRLQIQTAAACYDVITGSRLALGILTDEVDITGEQADSISNGREVQVDDLVEVAEKMGEKLGERMGEAVEKSKWLTSVVAIENGSCVLPAGSEVGIRIDDRFSVLDGSAVLTGLGEQRYIEPGWKIGEITIRQVTAGNSLGSPTSGDTPPVGSILVPGQ
jgi:hypothetical protein